MNYGAFLLAFLAGAQGSNVFLHGRPSSGFMNHGVSHLPKLGSIEDQWYQQTLDHSRPANDAKFAQKYQVNETWATEDGPTFLLLGGEGPASPVWLEYDTAIMSYAQTHGARVVQLEHRFYGDSQPLPDLSDLSLLSSEQALSDAAEFVQWYSSDNKLDDSSWVVFGGSYSGALAAWFRQRYPQLVVAAVASSAPVQPEINFVEYLEVTTASLQSTEHGPACVSAIAAATRQLQGLMSQGTEGVKQAEEIFNVCESQLSDPALTAQQRADNTANFYSAVAGNYMGVVQYNRDNKAFEGGDSGPTMTDLCSELLGGGDALEGQAAVNALMLKSYGASCLDVSFDAMITQMRQTALDAPYSGGTRQWIYQTCTEFGYYQSSDSSSQPFGHGFSIDFSTKQCPMVYGANVTIGSVQIDRTLSEYGGRAIGRAAGATRIVFPNGGWDQWHALGVDAQHLADNPALEAVFIPPAAHCSDMYPASAKDPAALTAARSRISELLGRWLREAEGEKGV